MAMIPPLEKSDLLMGRDESHKDEYTEEISRNLDRLLWIINVIQDSCGFELHVASGWRPPTVNAACGGAKKSLHQVGLAVDIRDLDGKLREWALENLEQLKSLGVYMEDFRWTQGWVHFQIKPPNSGRRIFIPYANPENHPMTNSLAWSGNYDKKFDGAA